MKNAARKASRCVVAILCFMGVTVISSGCSADCGWNGKVQAFIDENSNGKWDADESPLPNVKFTIIDRAITNSSGSEWESDSSGNARPAFFISCNNYTNLVISAEVPENLILTTSERLEVGSESGKTFAFGFARKK